jgi:hypothetical protein
MKTSFILFSYLFEGLCFFCQCTSLTFFIFCHSSLFSLFPSFILDSCLSHQFYFLKTHFILHFFVDFFLYLVIYFLRYLFILSFKSPYFYSLFSPSVPCMLRTPLSFAVPHMQFCFLVSLLTQTERLTGSRCWYLQCEISTRIFIVKQKVK